MTHGTRATYQRFACRCTPCRAAEAAYRHALRLQHVKGQLPMGSRIDAAQVKQMVRGMLIEGFTFAEMARRLGLKGQRLRLHTDKVTLRNYLRIRRLYRRTVSETGNAASR